jgi:hypothetical protein
MIYDAKKAKHRVACQFFVFCQNVAQRLIKKRRNVKGSIKLRSKRVASPPRDTNVDFMSSTWGKLLAKLSRIPGGPSIESREGKLFRRRFRVPWDAFVDLLQKTKDSNLFGDCTLKSFDCCGCRICPYAIKLLGVLRILGRNWCCDDVAEATGMGEATVRKGFLEWCENFVERYYNTYIYRPEGEKLTKMMDVYSRMGLPGCIGSTDCVHLKWDRCPIRLSNLCRGKEGYPSLSYSCTVDHHRRILGITRSNYGTRNDKTIVRLDRYITDVHYRLVNQDVEFDVFIDGNLVRRTGVYYLCDGGYHKWSCMINPMKHTSNRDDRLWSEWIESTRKDVECVFGILKGRFRFLRHGILLQTQEKIDTVFFTCAILHNLILEADGMDRRWEQTVEWDRLNPQPNNSDSGYDEDESASPHSVSLQEQRILERVAQYEPAIETEYEGNDVVEEVDINYEEKRKMLIKHFKTAYDRGLVQWPRCFPEVKRRIYNLARDRLV